MARKSDFLKAAVFTAAAFIFCNPLHARETEIVSGASSDALAMLEERFSSLSGSLGKMSEPPRFKGTMSLPPSMNGRINVPGGEKITNSQEGDKQ